MKDAVSKVPSTVLFLSKNPADSQLAQRVFEREAQKMEVFWTARSCGLDELTQLPEALRMDAFKNLDLVIVLQKPDDQSFLAFEEQGSRIGELERWQVPSITDLASIVQQQVTNLLVRLILKGGKRPAKPSQETVYIPSDQHATKPSSKGSVRVSLESKGRRGKKVTTVSGLPLDEPSLLDLATVLKRICGTGGTMKDGRIEIQGDHRDLIITELQKQGHKPKRVGG